jgi:hypothetical protein
MADLVELLPGGFAVQIIPTSWCSAVSDAVSGESGLIDDDVLGAIVAFRNRAEQPRVPARTKDERPQQESMGRVA